MTTRWDICAPRAGKDGKTFWHRIGTAFQGDKGINLVFDSLPLPDKEGRVAASLFEPRKKEGGQAAGAPVKPRSTASQDMDDEIPFAAEFR